MKKFLKQWLISESKFLICTYVPIVSTILFALLQIYFFPDSSMLGVGIFYLCSLSFVIYKCR
ncbi:O-antigen/teichoic acid export membrane protein [Enterobacter sp. Sphag1F]|nr:O-antigen/teichoic acid export membrane protein [Enterobacter sp. Sphag1F]NYI15897.1 O-antigen/teichoic acid export membrane protein [Enterobacter sp. Sphag71]